MLDDGVCITLLIASVVVAEQNGLQQQLEL